MAKITRQFIANDGTVFETAVAAHAHNERPAEGVAEFLATLGLPQRKITEYGRILTAWELHNQADQH